ncbi:exostosin domain-containing protein [Flavobacterium terrae]|uniref:Exostosin family protein n=1 Tax=Flavobacterium terrae TaxID=415425 RepID=A0A1M6FR51_9FLAO|nr:exostosin family protein [Flavobacterium terrae]SHJ00123.1 Exostosin family protein [Flavobacterium terrae]
MITKEMKIFIEDISCDLKNKRELFILTRPFWTNKGWSNSSKESPNWDDLEDYSFTDNVLEAQVYFIPLPINQYPKEKLDEINELCQKNKIKAYGYISGDFGENLGNYENIVFFRMGGFKSQLGDNNKGFPVPLSDHFQRLFHHDHPIPSDKSSKPIIGFCGHASLSQKKRLKEILKCIKENCRRFFKNYKRKDWEPMFASAYERAKLLQLFTKSSLIKTNFIFRSQYRAGAQTEEQRTKTTLEYYNNIKDSDYVLCVRGAGNFSVRLYETLMMGKIPLFVNTDCLLPFEDKIDWKKHVVWVEWKDRKNILQKVISFHNQLTNEEFLEIQINNRKLWKEILSVKGILELVKNDI